MRSRPSVSRPLAAVSLAATLVLFGGISAAVADAGADRHRANAGAAARHDARATTQPAPAAPTRVTRSLAELADIARANVLPGPTSDGFGRRSGFSPGGQHGGSTDHLPAVSENMELVG